MKTLLRNRITGFYFQGVNDWTAQAQRAFDFKCPERVVRFVRAAGLDTREVELVFAFEDARYDIRLPMDERFGLTPKTERRVTSPALSTPQSLQAWRAIEARA
ncbi:MAG TPA: hypothetical protein VG146_05395 [Verrucomicrobiae bacterium]|nr:hypothetical protein [Verrucomicrobiae bacterium]